MRMTSALRTEAHWGVSGRTDNPMLKAMRNKMIKPFLSAAVLLIAVIGVEEISANYQDVLLVINDNSSISSQIAQEYLVDKPDLLHICHVSATTDETIIGADQFDQQIVTPIRTYIQDNQLEDIINYIVTTKGLPLKLDGGGSISSIDARIGMIATEKDNCVLANCMFTNPYYMQDTDFSVLQFSTFRIVSRLTGYTLQDALDLISRGRRGLWAGTGLIVGQPNRDNDAMYDSYHDDYQQKMPLARDYLLSRSIPTNFVNDGSFPTAVSDVPFYYSWGSNHWRLGYSGTPHSNNWNIGFTSGSVGYMLVSTSARTFDVASYGQALLADLIADGLSGSLGHVAEPSTPGNPEPQLLAQYWTKGYNMGEAFMQSVKWYKMQSMLVGDPKMRLFCVVSGYVLDQAGSGVDGVTVTFSNEGGSTTTAGNGYYEKTLPFAWSGTATPSKSQFVFDPPSRSYSDLIADQADQNYTAQADCNNNGISDLTDIASGSSEDCNNNGIPDQCDISQGTSEDCNANGVPDECDIDPADPDGDGQVSGDCNSNQIPDECEPQEDCNNNGIQDLCDIAAGTSQDSDNNSILDECETPAPDNTSQPGKLQFSSDNYSVQEDDGSILIAVTRTDGNDGKVTVDYATIDATAEAEADYTALTGTRTFVDAQISETFTISIRDDPLPEGDEIVNLRLTNPTGGADLGSLYTSILTILDDDTDCNTNGIDDAIDILDGTSEDCNGNGVPDECEADTDGDGTIDDCDNCPDDPEKVEPGLCGCGNRETPGCDQTQDNGSNDDNGTDLQTGGRGLCGTAAFPTILILISLSCLALTKRK